MNDENYIAAFHQPDKVDINGGGYIISLLDGVHYEIIPPEISIHYAVAARFDGIDEAAWANKPEVRLFIETPVYKKAYRTGESLELKAGVTSETKEIEKVEFF